MKFRLLSFATVLTLSLGASSQEALEPGDMDKVLKNAVHTLSTLSGQALSSLNEINIRFENFNKFANVTMRGNGVTVKYRCTKDKTKGIECSAFTQSKMMDIVE